MTVKEVREKINSILDREFTSFAMEGSAPHDLLTRIITAFIEECDDDCSGIFNPVQSQEIADCLKNAMATLSEYENTTKNISQITNENMPMITNLISTTSDSRVKAASVKLNELHGKLKNELSKADDTIRTFRNHMEQMKKNSRFDKLTKAYNYAAYNSDMKPILKIGQTRDLDLCMLLIEVTNLAEIKKVNGQEAADKILVYIARLLSSLIRQENRIYRYSNDTFLVVMNRSAEEQLSSTETRVVEKLSKQKIVYGETAIDLSIATGKSFHKQEDDIDSFTDRAKRDKRFITL